MKLKPWVCKNGHTLGIIQINGNQVTRLMLYRHAVDLSAEQPADVDMMIGPLVGSLPVRCDICDDVKLWDMSVDALAEFIVKLNDEEMAKLVKRFEGKRVANDE